MCTYTCGDFFYIPLYNLGFWMLMRLCLGAGTELLAELSLGGTLKFQNQS